MVDSVKQLRKYNTTISKLFEIILSLNEEQQEMLLKQAELLPEKEKRAYGRKVCRIRVFFSTSERLYPSYIENISPEGLFIKAVEPMHIGKQILMLFNIKGINKTLKIWGQIVHTTSCGFGVKFENLKTSVANNLKNIILHKHISSIEHT
jgi:Tfp pilus assembly protein PilZ